MSTSLATLDPWFRPYAEYLVAAARSLGAAKVTSTRRSYVEQQRIWLDYVQGRRPLPALPPDRSMHVRGFAVDLVVGKYQAGGPPSPEMAALGQWWRAAGGKWGGERDPVHFEVS